MTLVPPYDHPHVMAGQGTAALELIEEVGRARRAGRLRRRRRADLGLRGGGDGSSHRSARCIGVEPEAGNDMQQSLARGEIVQHRRAATPSPTARRRRRSGKLTFPVMRERVRADRAR